VTDFALGEGVWIERLGSLRTAVRQELIACQLEAHVPDGAEVLDVGCGQGTQALCLARRGCRVVGVDPSVDLLSIVVAAAEASRLPIDVHRGSLHDLEALLGARTFEVVCAHGLLMYLPDLENAVAVLAARVAARGLLSLTFRNGAALAFRPGVRHQWQAALEAFDSVSYVNELSVSATAHDRAQVTGVVERLGFHLEAWYGVRVFTESAAVDQTPDAADFATLLRVEEIAGQRDPYRQVASQIHLIARRND
jgi:2-polyprenyl-3-methyl-5-hydroxy-6-metoxy-1,4-benzoquinol methylase